MKKVIVITISTLILITVFCLTWAFVIGPNQINKSNKVTQQKIQINKISQSIEKDNRLNVKSQEALQKKAVDIVIKKYKAKYISSSDDYLMEKFENVHVKIQFREVDQNGQYVVIVCPSSYPLSIYSYLHVDITTEDIKEEP